MSEPGKSEIAQEVKTPEKVALETIRQLKMATSPDYPTIRRLLNPRLNPENTSEIPTAELLGTNWKYDFVRHPLKYVDLEIKKTPIKPDPDFIEQSVRIREKVDPVIRSDKLTHSKNRQFFENSEEAYQEVDSLVNEIIEQL